MNTTTRTSRPSITAAHAEDIAVAAYMTARQLGRTVEQAIAARDSAYRDAMAQG